MHPPLCTLRPKWNIRSSQAARQAADSIDARARNRFASYPAQPMATHALHFLTIVGHPGEEAAAGVGKLIASRLQLAQTDPEGEFENAADPLTGASFHDEAMIGALHSHNYQIAAFPTPRQAADT